MKKSFLAIIFLFYFALALPSYAELSNNSGFISGQIWYSKDILKEGETVNIHTAVWNGEKDQLSVKVEFYDKNVILGVRDITINSLELKDVYVPWKITSGDHTISAKIIYSITTVSGEKKNIVLVRNETSDDKKFIPAEIKKETNASVGSENKLEEKALKVGSQISDILPENVNSSIENNFNKLEVLREETLKDVVAIKDKAQEDVNLIKGNNPSAVEILNEKKDVEYIVKKPIAYIKLFLFSILSFIFDNKIIFYGLLIIIIFYLLRYTYRKIRNR